MVEAFGAVKHAVHSDHRRDVPLSDRLVDRLAPAERMAGIGGEELVLEGDGQVTGCESCEPVLQLWGPTPL